VSEAEAVVIQYVYIYYVIIHEVHKKRKMSHCAQMRN